MIQQTIFPFKIETTRERLRAHGGLALMAEFNHGIGLRELTDQHLPGPGSNRGSDPSEVVDSVVLMLQGGGDGYHAVATNWLAKEKTTEEGLAWHNQRGRAETFHKELKIGFGMERMPCGQSYAKAVFLRIGGLTYNLFIGFKRLSCPGLKNLSKSS